MSVEVLVADDEAPALHELATLLAADPRVTVVHTASGGAEALRMLERGEIAVAFLDIHMPGITGFDLAKALAGLRSRPAVVFVTADDSGAIRAFDLEAVDYVLKPVRAERLSRALGRALASSAGGDQPDDETIPVTVGSTTRLVRRAEIRWVQGDGGYSGPSTPTRGPLARLTPSGGDARPAGSGVLRRRRSSILR